jgi:predicted GIY-YIG superfamily endonuclease
VFYAYVIESIANPKKRYVGHTADLRQRLVVHNQGKCKYTAKFRPWRIRAYFAFQTIDIARDFENYLKSGSGHAFANRHFWPVKP